MALYDPIYNRLEVTRKGEATKRHIACTNIRPPHDKVHGIQVDVTTLRRQKLVRRIDHQIELVRSVVEGHDPRGTWFWMDETGSYFVPIKYGRHTLELKKGLFSVQCQDLDEVEHVLCTFRGMVLNGDMDDHLTRVSGEIRKRFGKP